MFYTVFSREIYIDTEKIQWKAEKFMFMKINLYSGQLTWKRKRNLITGSVSVFLEYIDQDGN